MRCQGKVSPLQNIIVLWKTRTLGFCFCSVEGDLDWNLGWNVDRECVDGDWGLGIGIHDFFFFVPTFQFYFHLNKTRLLLDLQ